MTDAENRQGCIDFEAEVENSVGRLDNCVAEEFELFTRSQFKQRVSLVELNGKPAKASSKTKPGDLVKLCYLPEAEISLEPENLNLNIIFEDENVLVIDKARGIVVHPGAGNSSGTLVNGFLYHCGFRNGTEKDIPLVDPDSSASIRPGVVHRLDKDTSGVIIFAKNSDALEFLSSQFRDRKTEKLYLAILDGSPPKHGDVGGFIRRRTSDRKLFIHDEHKGRASRTFFTRLDDGSIEEAEQYPVSLVRFRPLTGRTHQLRVHARFLKSPIVGDPLYNRRKSDFPLMLHAFSLKILLPGESAPRCFTAPIPADMCSCISSAGMEVPQISRILPEERS